MEFPGDDGASADGHGRSARESGEQDLWKRRGVDIVDPHSANSNSSLHSGFILSRFRSSAVNFLSERYKTENTTHLPTLARTGVLLD